MPARSPDLPRELDIDFMGDGRKRVVRVGSAMWGHVFAAEPERTFYRIIPLAYLPTWEMRQKAVALVGRDPLPGLPRYLRAEQVTIADDDGYFVIEYQVVSASAPAFDLETADPLRRLERVCAVMNELGAWRQRLDQALFLMPSDIVFVDNIPILLFTPDWGLPPLDAIFQEPIRSRYLPPEAITGKDSILWRGNSDVFSLGMIALQCFYTLPLADDSETALMLAAAGSVPELSSQPGTLPYWMYKAPGLQEALKLLSRTVSSARVRSAVEPFSLARSLNQCRTRMLPERAAEELRQMGQSREAFNLLHDAMLVQTTHELALLAGEIALHDLNDPLEAIDILEKAIERDHHRVAAYVHQFEAISKLTRLLNEFRLLEQAPSARERMDDLIWRDFNRMDADQQRDNEVAMSRYFLFRRQYEAAAHFIFPRLRMGATHMWWKFDLNLNYVRALAGQQRIAEASALLRYVAGKLDFARQGKTLAHHEITRLDADVRELADQLSVEL